MLSYAVTRTYRISAPVCLRGSCCSTSTTSSLESQFGLEVLEVPARSYEIRIRGRIPRAELEEFENLQSTTEPAQTVLRGTIRDQAALQGVLGRLHGLGLELVEVRRLPMQGRSSSSAEQLRG